MWVVAEIEGVVDNHGLLAGLDFGEVKAQFRKHLDWEYDHHLLLNEDDPLVVRHGYEWLPGLRSFGGDPTTENIARWIGEWVGDTFPSQRIKIEVWETQVNSATWEEVFEYGTKGTALD
jgi:6-pyruvoyl-tetrahydropterin synthase